MNLKTEKASMVFRCLSLAAVFFVAEASANQTAAYSAQKAAPSSRSAITEKNWQAHPEIVAIRKIVSSVNAGLKNGTFKTAQRKFESCGDQYFTLRKIARTSKGDVTWYQDYSEGEDSAWDYHYYYDNAHRLRFVLIDVYAANNTREQHRAYFDEDGKLIWKDRRTLRGSGYFGPQNIEELVREDPNKQFADDEGCREIKPQPGRRVRKS